MATPFLCQAFGYQVASPGEGVNSSLQEINMVIGNVTTLSPDIGFEVNAIGFNTLDDFIYGMIRRSNRLVRIEADGTTTDLEAVPNLPLPPQSYIAGAIDAAGHLFIYDSNDTRFYVIDVDQSSPIFGQLLDPTAGFILDTPPFGTLLSTPVDIADWTFNPVDGMLYGIRRGDSAVILVEPTTGVVTPVPSSGLPLNSTYGAIFSFADGEIFAIENVTGIVYRVTIQGGSAIGEVFTQSVPAFGNDGTSCIDALIQLDFGDAPDISPGNGPGDYSTLLANNGPRHQIINELFLGTVVTPDSDGRQNEDATGDDIPAGIQDDAMPIPLASAMTTDTSYSITFSVTNNTGQTANIYGWLDWNNDGIFQGEEGISTTIASDPVNPRQVTFTFLKPPSVTLTSGIHFIRLRITTDDLTNANATDLTLEDTRSLGPASDGEVEDYSFEILDPPKIEVRKYVNKSIVEVGDTLTYKVMISNIGTIDVDNVIFTDPVPDGSTFIPCSLIVEGCPVDGDPNLGVDIGTIATGDSIVVCFMVTVDALPVPPVLINKAFVDFQYQVPGGPVLSGNAMSNEVSTQVVEINLEVIKTANKDFVVVGDTVIYTVVVKNKCNITASNVLFTDPLPPYWPFIHGSFTINNLPIPAVDPNKGVNLGSLAPGESAKVRFKVKVMCVPCPAYLVNMATVRFKLLPISTGPFEIRTVDSNKVITKIEPNS